MRQPITVGRGVKSAGKGAGFCPSALVVMFDMLAILQACPLVIYIYIFLFYIFFFTSSLRSSEPSVRPQRLRHVHKEPVTTTMVEIILFKVATQNNDSSYSNVWIYNIKTNRNNRLFMTRRESTVRSSLCPVLARNLNIQN